MVVIPRMRVMVGARITFCSLYTHCSIPLFRGGPKCVLNLGYASGWSRYLIGRVRVVSGQKYGLNYLIGLGRATGRA